MPVLDPKHDHMHPVEGDSAWSESYYFNAYDPEADCGVYTRIGIRPHEGTMDVLLAAWLPGSEVALVRETREQREMCGSPLQVAGVGYTCLEPGFRWRLTAEQPAHVFDLEKRTERETHLSMDLTFQALIPLIGVDGQGGGGGAISAATGQSTGKGHFEQAGRWIGGLGTRDARVAFGPEARGNRDKSWGPRRWSGPRMWRWFSINVGDDVHLGGIRIGTDAGDLHRGWVWKDGEHTSVVEWRVRTQTRSDGVTQKKCLVTAIDKRGRAHELRGDVLRVFPGGARAGETVVNEGLTRWTYEGRTGHGIAEYLHQFDARARPRVPIE